MAGLSCIVPIPRACVPSSTYTLPPSPKPIPHTSFLSFFLPLTVSMSKLDRDLVSKAVDKILAFSKGEEVDGSKGKIRKFTETIELQVSHGMGGS